MRVVKLLDRMDLYISLGFSNSVLSVDFKNDFRMCINFNFFKDSVGFTSLLMNQLELAVNHGIRVLN